MEMMSYCKLATLRNAYFRNKHKTISIEDNSYKKIEKYEDDLEIRKNFTVELVV
jgi:hypothetical protein